MRVKIALDELCRTAKTRHAFCYTPGRMGARPLSAQPGSCCSEQSASAFRRDWSRARGPLVVRTTRVIFVAQPLQPYHHSGTLPKWADAGPAAEVGRRWAGCLGQE